MFQLQSLPHNQHHGVLPLPTPPEQNDQEYCTVADQSPNSEILVHKQTPPTTLTPEESGVQAKQESFQRALLGNLSSAPEPPEPSPSSTFSVSSYFTKSESDTKDGKMASLAVPAFRTTVQPHHMASAVNSFRALKV
jgi:hypothetical protein